MKRFIRSGGFVAGVVSVALVTAMAFASALPLPHSPLQDTESEAASPADFTVQESMVPMRDHVKLHTVVIIPTRHTERMPALLFRTPYGSRFAAGKALHHTDLPVYLRDLDGYIFILQDIRGRHGSEGVVEMERPLRGPFNRSTTDETTDAYDTIEWIVKQVHECDGGVGLLGTSYSGGLVLSALLDPHPAVKVAVAANPEVDLWKGDDYFHNGAFRQADAFEFLFKMEWDNTQFRYQETDLYDWWLHQGSARDVQRQYMRGRQRYGLLLDHPSYDTFWQDQSLVPRLAASTARKVPTMFVQGLFDQDDIYGAAAAFAATGGGARDGGNVFVAGPWFHAQFNSDLGERIGNIDWKSATADVWRRESFKPFLAHYLKSGPDPQLPPVQIFDTGEKKWRQSTALEGPSSSSLFLAPGHRVAMQPPIAAGHDSFVADPANPVPYQRRPILSSGTGRGEKNWQQWLTDDQRFVDGRPDVLTYTSDVLRISLTIKGHSKVHLFAATTGSDADWVVKLIDVAPEDEAESQLELRGYELMIAADIMRGRYRGSLSVASPIVPNEIQEYAFELPYAAHTFLPGHRVMIQIQSSWFPLYDRNPQSFVRSIMDAPADAYRSAIHTLSWGPGSPSRIDIPVL